MVSFYRFLRQVWVFFGLGVALSGLWEWGVGCDKSRELGARGPSEVYPTGKL